MNRRSVIPLASLFLTIISPAADLPDPAIPSGVGVNIHFTRGRERDLDLIADAGFKFVRMDFSWQATEPKPGEYRWGDYDELTANLGKRGIRPLYILDYSNALYEETVTSRDPVTGMERRDVASPSKPSSYAAFARWAAAAATHYKGKRVVWEIWNEPNIGFWKPQPNAGNYAALVLATCRSIREADPTATILAPASSGFPWEFFETLFRAGALEYLDGVSVHPYRSYGNGPETAGDDYLRLRGLIERYAPPAKRRIPIISGEWGYATQAKGGVSEATQAAFIARQQLSNLASGVPLSIWYDWKNDGPDRNDAEHNFGTVHEDLTPKPAYNAIRTLTRELTGFRIARELAAPPPCRALLLCNGAGDQKLAAWTTASPTEFNLSAPGLTAENVSAVDGAGTTLTPPAANGKLTLPLGPAPVYVTFKRPLPEFTAASAWKVGPDLETRIFAGKKDGIRVPVHLTNPFGQPAVAKVTLKGLPGVPESTVELRIAPGESASHVFPATLHRRKAAPLTATVAVEYSLVDAGGNPRPLGLSESSVAFLTANPLELTCAPVAAGMRVTIASPSAEPFSGSVTTGSPNIRVDLTQKRPEATILIPSGPERSIELRDTAGNLVETAPALRFTPLEIDGFGTALDGDAKIPAESSVSLTNTPAPDAPYPKAWKLDYRFAHGWRFVRCVPHGPDGRTVSPQVPGKPAALGMWIHGDGSKNSTRCRLIDSAGQTFQPTGPDLDWRGWRWITFDLTNMSLAGHWGGANDGIPRGPLRVDCPLLIDGRNNATAGTIHFTGMAWIAPPESEVR